MQLLGSDAYKKKAQTEGMYFKNQSCIKLDAEDRPTSCNHVTVVGSLRLPT